MVTARLLPPFVRCAVLALVVVCASPLRAEVVATGASFSRVEDATRFTLELSGEASYRMFAVDGPPRLVVDVDDVTFDLAADGDPGDLIADWRYGALSATSGRIVFDLARPALVARRFVLPALAGRSARLVFDIEPVDAPRFADAAARATATIASSGTSATAGPAGDGPVVVIDPGHGGIDPGAAAKDGALEKDVVLDFARALSERLSAVPGLTVRLTRSDDSFLSLGRRIRIARAYGADLFISVHADAAPQDYVRGATVYTLSERPSDAQAAAIAARENLADAVSGAIEPDLKEDVSGILADLLRRETKVFSHAFADHLVDALSPSVSMNVNPHRYARFRVLMAHDIPSVLLELGYMTNSDDSQALLSASWREAATGAVVAAVEDFFGLDDPVTTTQVRAAGPPGEQQAQ